MQNVFVGCTFLNAPRVANEASVNLGLAHVYPERGLGRDFFKSQASSLDGKLAMFYMFKSNVTLSDFQPYDVGLKIVPM